MKLDSCFFLHSRGNTSKRDSHRQKLGLTNVVPAPFVKILMKNVILKSNLAILD
jgi:hypothetical protein